MSFFSRKTIALAVLGAVSGPGLATTLTVNSTADIVDATVGNGSCQTSSSVCTLRAAIQEANALSNGPHTIIVPAGIYSLSLTGLDDTAAGGDLDINANMSIEGAGADTTTVQTSALAGSEYRIFHVGANDGQYSVTIKGLSIKGGASIQGAGIFLHAGTLDLVDSQVDGNSANMSQFNTLGGGIFSQGTLRIKNSTISNNSVVGNTNGFGGGVYVASNAGPTQITNSTIANNTVSGIQGAGIHNASYSALTIANSTIANNIANGANATGVGIANQASTNVRIKNTILAQNRNSSGVSVNDCYGPVGTDGYNFVSLATTGTCTLTAGTGDQIGTSSSLTANLGILASNGGPTQTIIPLIGSLVIDKGNPSGCTAADASSLTTDQRGLPRSVAGVTGAGAICDIGAAEYNPSNSGGTVSATGPAANALSFTAYTKSQMGGSLAGFNPDIAKNDTATLDTGLTYTRDVSVSTRGSVSINPATGYFNYMLDGTGSDTFRYTVRNAANQTASADVTINVLPGNTPGTSAPVIPQGGVTVSAKSTHKLRMSLPFADPDQSSSPFVLTYGIGTLAQKGTVSVSGTYVTQPYFAYVQYTPNDGATGADTFQVEVSDGGFKSLMLVTVNLTTGSAIPTANSIIVSSIPRTGTYTSTSTSTDTTSLSKGITPTLPSGASFEIATNGGSSWSTSSVSGTNGTLTLTSSGNYTYAVSSSLLTTATQDLFQYRIFYTDPITALRVNSLPGTLTLNFAAVGMPVASPASASSVPRTGTFTSTTSLSATPSGLGFDVSVSSGGQWGTTATSNSGTLTLTNPSTGVYTFTVPNGTAVASTTSQEIFQYRPYYTDSAGSRAYGTPSTLTLTFAAVAGAPVLSPVPVSSVPRVNTYNSQTPLSQYVTPSLPASQTFEIAGTSGVWSATSATGTYGMLTLGVNGAYVYAVNMTAYPTGVPASQPEVFQYRVRYPDPSNSAQTLTTAPAALTLSFANTGTGNPPGFHPQNLTFFTGETKEIPWMGVPGGGSTTPISSLQYIVTALPSAGTITAGAAALTSSSLNPTSPVSGTLRYTATTPGTYTLSFKVRDPALPTGSQDSQVGTITITVTAGSGASIDEGGGGSMGPLALLALLGLYARRRIK